MFLALTISLAVAIALAGAAIGWFARELTTGLRFHRIKVSGTTHAWVIGW